MTTCWDAPPRKDFTLSVLTESQLTSSSSSTSLPRLKWNPIKAPQTLQCPQIGRNRQRISKTLTKLFTLAILIQAIIEIVEQLTEYALMLSRTRSPSTFLAMKTLLLCSITPSPILKEIEIVLPFTSLIVRYFFYTLPPFTSAVRIFFGV